MTLKKTLLALLLPLFLAGCGMLNSPKGNEIPLPDSNSAVIVFLSGEVTVTNDGLTRQAEIGQMIPPKAVLQVGPEGSCDLQLGNSTLIQVDEKTLLTISSLTDKDGLRRVDMNMERGTVACKVNKLFNEEKFEIQTQGTTIGIRGTQFLFSSDPEGTVILAVSEGAVQIQPSVDLTPLEGVDTQLLNFPVIKDDEQIAIPLETAERARKAYERSVDLLAGNNGSAGTAEEIRLAVAALTHYGYVSPLSQTNRQRLLKIRDAGFIQWNKKERPVSFSVTGKPESLLLVNGRPATGAFSGVIQPDTQIKVLARTRGFADKEQIFTPQIEGENLFKIVQERLDSRTLRLTFSPEETTWTMNGIQTGQGSVEKEIQSGETLVIEASAPGCIPLTKEISYEDITTDPIPLKLETAVMERLKISDRSISGLLAVPGHLIISDSEGTLKKTDLRGEILWSHNTSHSAIETTRPVTDGKGIYLSGLEDLTAVDLESGRRLFTRSLNEGESHIFGRKPVPFEDQLLYPTDSGFLILDAESGEELNRVTMEQGSRMTPLIYETEIVAADNGGNLHFYNRDGELLRSLPTPAGESIALSPARDQRYGFLADKQGQVLCVDMKAGELNWTTELSKNQRIPVTDTPLIWKNTLLIFSRGRLFAMDKRGGRLIYSTPKIYTTVPMIHNGIVYLGGEDNTLQILEAETGKVLQNIKLSVKLTTAGVLAEENIVFGNESGELIRFRTVK